MNKLLKILFFIWASVFLFSCKSEPKRPADYVPLDYTKEDVIKNEINNIRRLQQTECVKALYHAVFLGNKDVIEECVKIVENKLKVAIEQKDFIEAERFAVSLNAVNALPSFYSQKTILEEINKDLPGTKVSAAKRPVTTADCINATVTMWVDKGVKVQNGNMVQDIVIGSGFFIDERGYLITNYHVIQSMVDPKYEGYSRLFIKLPADTETKIPAKVIGYDSVLDLALVKADIEPPFCLTLGSSEDLSVGDKVSAIGAPIGLEGTLTSGIISSVDRKLTTMGVVFQLDAAVNSGNSGGPLIDTNNKVQAIVFAGIMKYQGLNFAIPVEYLKNELPYLYKGGDVIHGWIGSYGNTKKVRTVKSGLEIYYNLPGGTADFSKLSAGDIITEVNGIKVLSLEQFQMIMMKYEPGTLLKIKYVDGKDTLEKSTVIYLEKRPEYPTKTFYESDLVTGSFIPLFGMALAPSSTTNKKLYTITKVINGTTADEMGFSENDPVTVRKIELDDTQEALIAQLYVQRRKKGFLDMTMVIGTSYDSPYYF